MTAERIQHTILYILIAAICTTMIAGCTSGSHRNAQDSTALYSIDSCKTGKIIRIFNTDRSIADSIEVTCKFNRIICMSSSYVAYLSAIGCDSVICGISGTDYISDTAVARRVRDGHISEVGSDSAPDYEKILSLHPDLVAAYSIPGSGFIQHLKSLGIPVLTLNDYLENDPLGRASYIRIFGTLTGKERKADSVFTSVSKRYNEIKQSVAQNMQTERTRVLVNIPYSDVWYIPGGDSYMSKLVNDAGGEILGAIPAQSASGTISIEQAFELSQNADIWLNPGWCNSLQSLYGVNPLFASFGCSKNVYNNTLRTSPNGGNDFWESGALHPELILSDLAQIFHPGILPNSPLNYYLRLKY